MALYTRLVGSVSQNIQVFFPDATVTTGVGLGNIVASTVRLSWFRSDSTGVSSYTLTSGTLGSFTGSTMTQWQSTSTLGMYQISLPDSLFASGDHAMVFLMSSTATFAPIPVTFDLSSKVVAVQSGVGVTTLSAGVSSITTPVTASSVTAGVNVTSIVGTAAVTSAAGVLGPVAVSSLTTPVTVSAGTVRVSAATIPFGVSSLTAGALGNFFDTGAFFFSTAVVSSVVYEIAKNATLGGSVDVTSFYGSAVVTSAAGVMAPGRVTSIVTVGVSSVTDKGGYGVTSLSIPVSVSSGSVAVTSAIAAVNEAIADALLGRNVSGGANTGRLVKEALYPLRNRVDLSTGIVYQTDDLTSSWAFAVSTTPGDPVYLIDPI